MASIRQLKTVLPHPPKAQMAAPHYGDSPMLPSPSQRTDKKIPPRTKHQPHNISGNAIWNSWSSSKAGVGLKSQIWILKISVCKKAVILSAIRMNSYQKASFLQEIKGTFLGRMLSCSTPRRGETDRPKTGVPNGESHRFLSGGWGKGSSRNSNGTDRTFPRREAPGKILCKKESNQTKGLWSRHSEGFPLDNLFPERRLRYARLGVNTVVVFWESYHLQFSFVFFICPVSIQRSIDKPITPTPINYLDPVFLQRSHNFTPHHFLYSCGRST